MYWEFYFFQLNIEKESGGAGGIRTLDPVLAQMHP